MNNIPDNLDWVTRRNNCSVAVMFEMLKLQIEGDIKVRNELIRAESNNRYRFGKIVSAEGVVVFRDDQQSDVRHSVTFTTAKGAILVRNESGETVLEATPTISDDGKCRLMVEGEERELWHVRKQALERLFFIAY